MPSKRNPVYRWPDWMPPPVVDGYSVKTDDRRGRADFDEGTRLRIIFNTDESTIDCTVFLDSLQSNWLETFERDVLKQGGRYFMMPLWIGGKMVSHRAKFKGRPEMNSREGFEWAQYSFILEVNRREGLGAG